MENLRFGPSEFQFHFHSQVTAVRKSIQGHIPTYNFLAVFFLSFIQALDLSYFTSRTPHKNQQVEQLLYSLFIRLYTRDAVWHMHVHA